MKPPRNTLGSGDVTEHALTYLIGLAAFTGVAHTLMGPDHYVPFIALARAGAWSLLRTVVVTALCGVGHVLGSVLLGTVGIAVGAALGALETFEAIRGDVAAWLLLGFGLVYTGWGIRRGMLAAPHDHWHIHKGGLVHRHGHDHEGAIDRRSHMEVDDHTHMHTVKARRAAMTTWTLFVVFVFGPCEVLIPQLMVPAAQHNWWSVFLVVLVFGIATVGTMTLVVIAGYLGLKGLSQGLLERYAHATAGLALVACGLAIKLGL